MKIYIVGIFAFWATLMMLGYHSDGCKAQTQITQRSLSEVRVEKIALMPFLTGQLESPNAPIAKPLSKPLSQLVLNARGLPQGTDEIMNRIVSQALKVRFQDRVVSTDHVAEAYQAVLMDDQALDTPRKRAIRLGEALEANLVMVGAVWRYREKGVFAESPDSPASVGFALYLVDVETGARLWRGSFDGTQKTLSQDVIGSLKQLNMGLRWLSAEELAQYGLKSVLRKLPLH